MKGEQKAFIYLCLLFHYRTVKLCQDSRLCQGGPERGVPPVPVQGRGLFQKNVQVQQARQEDQGHLQQPSEIPSQEALWLVKLLKKWRFM